ncbi:MAG: HlyD family efflux transporter periplasmic adaptor subunit, partial [Firmicutes bacterium]|nr:HlyD family efflux transporter periplasmic adaptor subunit [Bacillota bacterium]
KLFIWLGVALVVVFAIVMGIRSLVIRVDAVMEQFSQMEAVVERGDLEVWVSGNGTVTAAVEEAVRAGTAGIIETYRLADGLEVAAGDELVTLQFQDLSTEIKLRELDIANLEEQKDNLEEQEYFTLQANAAGQVHWLKKKGDRVQGGDLIAHINLGSSGDENGGADEPIASEPVPVYAPSEASSWKIVEILKKKDVRQGDALVKLKNEDIAHQLDLIDIQLEQARLRLADLKQQQEQNRADSVIRAPISGTVVLPEAAEFGVGMSVPQGALLATIVDYSQLQAVIPVDELDINKVKVGQRVEITAEALPGETISGKVAAISSTGKIAGSVATFDVTVSIDPVAGLKAGMSVSASILVDVRTNTLLVPIEAVFEEDGVTKVMLAATEKEKGPGIGPGTPVEVVTGAYNATHIEILEGLAEGQKIIIQGSVLNPFGPQGEIMFGPGQGGQGQ